MLSRSLEHAINLFCFQNKLILFDQAISMIHLTISLTGVYSKGLMYPIKKILHSQSF